MSTPTEQMIQRPKEPAGKKALLIQEKWKSYIKDGSQKAFDTLYQECQSYIKPTIYKFTSYSLDIQEEAESLVASKFIKILNKYREKEEALFSTYFGTRARGITQDYVEKERNQHSPASKIDARRARDIKNILGQYGENLSTKEIAQIIIESDEISSKGHWRKAHGDKEKLSLETIIIKIRIALERDHTTMSLDSPPTQGSETKFYGLTADEKTLRPEDILEQEENLKLLEGLIDQLPKQERDVFKQNILEGTCLKEIGEGMGVSEARASQILRTAKRQLKDLLLDPLGNSDVKLVLNLPQQDSEFKGEWQNQQNNTVGLSTRKIPENKPAAIKLTHLPR